MGFSGTNFVSFGLRMQEILNFKTIFVTGNSNKLQKTRFWTEKSVEDVVTLKGLPFNSSIKNWDVPLVFLERP
jgi:hypothetical protein